MAQIPSAEGFGQVVAQPGPYVDTSSSAAGAGLGQAVFRAAGQLQAVRNEEERQAAAVRDAADRAEAANAVETGRLGLRQLADRLDEEVRQGTVAKDDAEKEWTFRASDLISDRVSGAPQALGNQVRQGLDVERGEQLRRVRRAVSDRNIADTRAGLLGVLEGAERDALTDRPRAVAKAAGALQAIGAFAGYGPDEQAKLLNTFRERTALTVGEAAVNAVRHDNAALDKVGQRLDSDEFADMDPRSRQHLQTQIEAYKVSNDQRREVEARRREAESDRLLRRAEGTFTASRALITEGKPLSQEYVTVALRDMAGTPYEAAFRELLHQVPERTAFGLQPIVNQEQLLLQMRSQINAQGTSPEAEKRFAELERMRAAKRQAFAADPLAAGQEYGGPAVAPIAASSIESLVAGMAQRLPAVAYATDQLGEQAPPLLRSEAQLVARWMGAMAPAEKEAAVKLLYSGLGHSAAMATFKLMGQDAPQMAVAAGLYGRQVSERTTFLGIPYGQERRRSVAQLMFEGENLLKNKQVQLPQDRLLNAEFLNYIGTSIPTPEARQAALAATSSVYAKLTFEAGRYSDSYVDSSLFRKAAEYITGGIIEHNGVKVLPPAYGMSASQARDLLSGVTADQVKTWGGVAGMTDQQAAEYIRRAPLESQTLGKYRVRAGAGILQRRDGAPFEMRF
jgi:hypothetical protein